MVQLNQQAKNKNYFKRLWPNFFEGLKLANPNANETNEEGNIMIFLGATIQYRKYCIKTAFSRSNHSI